VLVDRDVGCGHMTDRVAVLVNRDVVNAGFPRQIASRCTRIRCRTVL